MTHPGESLASRGEVDIDPAAQQLIVNGTSAVVRDHLGSQECKVAPLSTQDILARLDHMDAHLDEHVSSLREALRDDILQHGLDLSETAHKIDKDIDIMDSDVRRHGLLTFRADPTTFFDISKTIAEKKPLTLWYDVEDLVRRQGDGWVLSEVSQSLLGIGGTFNAMHPSLENLRFRFVYDDSGQSTDPEYIHSAKAYLEQELHGLRIITDGQMADVTFVNLADYKRAVPSITHSVVHSKSGVPDYQGTERAFVFHPWMRKWISLQNYNYRQGDRYHHILASTMPAIALRMAPFLDTKDERGMHLLISPSDHGMPLVKIGLAAAGYVRPDDSPAFSASNITTFEFDASEPSTLSNYQFAALLQRHTAHYRRSLEASAFTTFTADTYQQINYEQSEPLAQDRAIVERQLWTEVLLSLAAKRFADDPQTLFRPGEVAHIGIGASPYTAQLSSIWSVPEEGAVLGIDISPRVREHLERLRTDPSYDRAIRERWQQEIIAAVERLYRSGNPTTIDRLAHSGITPDIFAHADEVSRKQVRPIQASIQQLPKMNLRLKRMYAHFAIDSSFASQGEYDEAIGCLTPCLDKDDPEARLVMVITENSDRLYPDGSGRSYVAIKTSARRVEVSLLDRGFEVETLEYIDEHIPDDQRLRPGESFVLLTARRRRQNYEWLDKPPLIRSVEEFL